MEKKKHIDECFLSAKKLGQEHYKSDQNLSHLDHNTSTSLTFEFKGWKNYILIDL